MKKREQKKTFQKEKSYSPLRPLVDANKIRVNSKPYDPTKDKHTAVYNEFKKRANSPSITQPQKQLADFIIQNLAKSPDQLGNNPQKQYGALDYVDLRKTPYVDKKTNERMDYYSGSLGKKEDEQGIILSPFSTAKYPSNINPLIVLSHEGVHGLDDAYMRTHQNEVVDYLVQNAPKNDNQLKKLITDTQNILNEPAFSQGYTYDDFFKDAISKGLENLNAPDFQKVQQSLRQDRKNGKDSGDNFMAFSEFPAFAIEKLYTPWTPSPNPRANEFLSNIMQGVQRNFQELGLDNQRHPDIIQAFRDRLSELNRQSNSQQLPLTNLPKRQKLDSQMQVQQPSSVRQSSQLGNQLFSGFGSGGLQSQNIPLGQQSSQPSNQFSQFGQQAAQQQNLLNAQQQEEYNQYRNQERSAFDDSPILSPRTWLQQQNQQQELQQKQEEDIHGNPFPNQPQRRFASGGPVSSSYDPYLNTYNYTPPLSPAEYMDNQIPDSGYEDGGYNDPYMSYANPYDNDGAQYSFKEGGSVGRLGLSAY